MTSPVSELLVQEGLCTDLFKTISESVEATRHVEADVSSVSGQGDIVGKLLDRMIQILPPEERNIFGATEDKNIEEIIEEANELIRATTPLFSSTDSGERSWNKTSKALSKASKASESCNRKDDLEEVVTPNKSKSGTSSICSSMESIIVKDSLSHDLSDRGRSFQMQGSGSSDKLEKDIMDIFSRQDKPNNNSLENQPERGREMESTRDQDSEFSKRAIDESNKKIRNIGGTKPKDQELPKTNTNVINIESKSEIKTQAELENSNEVSLHTLSNSHKDPEAQLEALRQKYASEIQELKLAHNKEIYGLTKQITCLNDKIFELQKHSQIEKSPDLKIQEIERLENEIKCQEQLFAGYERENKKLCKEISNLKEGWKQRESKLMEEKQRLQNELQGMVSKTTTDTLQEQLKDARETIVKLQIEVTSYKSKNRELEMTCDRLRVETQSLQRELSNCRNPGGRRDKYALLASGNVGSQILELKNVIARKDMEIAQMSTTLRILKGELSNREVPMSPRPGGNLEEQSQQLELTVSQLQTSLAVERQNYRDLAKEKDNLLKENLDLKRQVRELESIVKRRQRSDSCFPVAIPNPQTTSRLAQLEKELSSRQESLTTLHSQFISMQKKYEDHIQELENRLKESRDEIQAMKVSMKKEEANQKMSARKTKLAQPVVKEETHLLATIRGLRQEVATKEKDINKLNKEVEEMRQTNRKLQKEREKQLNTMPAKMGLLREKPNLKKMEKSNTITGTRNSIISPNNNIDPMMFAELQESNMIMKSKNKSLQEEVKRLEQDLIAMHNKRVHDLNMLQSEHELETARLVDERAALIAQSSSSELEGQLYTQQMVINHLKNRLKQMEELKNEVTMLRAERDHLEQRLSVVNKEMCYLQNASAHSPESIQYKTLLEKLETLEKNQEIREQKLNAVRELLSRSTQGQGQCSGTCRDKLLDKNRQICFYRAQMDRILESLVEIRRTK